MTLKLMMLGTTLLAAAFSASGAQACKFMPLSDAAERQAEAASTVASATAIIDAVVVRPYKSETEPALLRASRVIKGPRGRRLFKVAGATSCHIQFRQVGFRTRVLLFGGPKVYTANMYRVPIEDIDAVLAAQKRR